MSSNPESSKEAEEELSIKLKRKYKHKIYIKTYISRRVQERNPNNKHSRAGASSSNMFITLSILLTIIVGSNKTNYLKTLLSILWPNQLVELKEGDKEKHRIVYIVIIVSVL